MKIEVKKTGGQPVVLTVTIDGVKKPLVISGLDLEILMGVIATAKRSDDFLMSMEVR